MGRFIAGLMVGSAVTLIAMALVAGGDDDRW